MRSAWGINHGVVSKGYVVKPQRVLTKVTGSIESLPLRRAAQSYANEKARGRNPIQGFSVKSAQVKKPSRGQREYGITKDEAQVRRAGERVYANRMKKYRQADLFVRRNPNDLPHERRLP